MTPAPGPDLKAWDGFLYYPSVSIGGQSPSDTRRGLAQRPGPLPAGTSEIPTVIVGVAELPAVRVQSSGSFPGYHTCFYANDVLWWDRECSSGNQWVDYFGHPWTPPDTGLINIRIVVDARNQCAETDETNNVAEFQVHAVPGGFTAGLIELLEWRNGYPYRVETVTAGTPISLVAWTFGRGAYPNVREVITAGGQTRLDHRVSLSGGSIWPAIQIDTVRFVPEVPGNYLCRVALDPDREYPQQSSDDDENSARLTVTSAMAATGAAAVARVPAASSVRSRPGPASAARRR